MALSVDQLERGLTEDQALAFLLDTLQSLDFDLTSWHEGSVQRNLLTAFARGVSGFGTVAQKLVRQVLVRPEGLWLDARGNFFLQLPRLEAVRTVRTISITSAPSSPVLVVTESTRIVAGLTAFLPFELAEPIAIDPGETVTLEVQCVEGGIGGNTPEQPSAEGLGGTVAAWVGAPRIPGAAREGDERYRLRQDRRLSELTYSVGLRAYELWALTASPSVRRAIAVNNYPVDNEIRIALDPGTPEQIAQVEAALIGRHPPNDVPIVGAANVVPVPIALNPRVRRGVTEAQIAAQLDRAIWQDMPIGGWRIAQGVAGRLLREKLSEALLCKNGAFSSGLVTPATDIVLGPTDVVSPAYSINLEFGGPL